MGDIYIECEEESSAWGIFIKSVKKNPQCGGTVCLVSTIRDRQC